MSALCNQMRNFWTESDSLNQFLPLEKYLLKGFYIVLKSETQIQCSSARVIIKPPNNTKVEVWRTICPHDHKEKPLSVTIAARIAIDKMFQVVKSIKPKIIFANLEKMNTLIVEENVKKHQDLARKDEKDKPLIIIPLEKDLYNYLSRHRKKHFINGQTNMHLGELHNNKRTH